MKKAKKSGIALLVVLLFVVLLEGCNKGATDNQGQIGEGQVEYKANTEPVKLSLYTTMKEDVYQQAVATHIQKKFPYITLNYVYAGGNNIAARLPELITAGTIPDIIYASPGDIDALRQSQVFTDLTPLIKKHNFDLGRYSPGVIEGIKQYFDPNQLPVLPESIAGAALFYNTSIFDMFGVSYPKDGMTWDQTRELAVKVTRNEGGQQIKGFDFGVGYLINNNQLSLRFVDPKTGKTDLNNDGWKAWFNTMKSFYEIAGNEVTKNEFNKGPNYFLKEQTLAMFANASGMLNNIPEAVEAGLKWDMATLPYFANVPETGIQLNTTFYLITPTSEHKDQAFDVIAELLSDEVQAANARNGRMTILNNPKVKDEFGKDLPYLQGKNVAAIYPYKIAKASTRTEYDKLAKVPLRNQFQEFIMGNKDVNTALRDAEEETNKAIQERKSQ
jgi:multiple sugar transport system substrate-binding protein